MASRRRFHRSRPAPPFRFQALVTTGRTPQTPTFKTIGLRPKNPGTLLAKKIPRLPGLEHIQNLLPASLFPQHR